MAIITVEDFRKKTLNGEGVPVGEIMLMRNQLDKFMTLIGEEEKDKNLTDEIQNFYVCFSRLINLNASDYEISESLDTLTGFGDFLESVEPGQSKSNAQRIIDEVGKNTFNGFLRYFEKANKEWSLEIENLGDFKELKPSSKEEIKDNPKNKKIEINRNEININENDIKDNNINEININAPKNVNEIDNRIALGDIEGIDEHALNFEQFQNLQVRKQVNMNPTQEMTAAAYIENLQRTAFRRKVKEVTNDDDEDILVTDINGVQNPVNVEEYYLNFLRIMAAREIANSERGNKSRLVHTMVTPRQVEERVNEFKENFAFSKFKDYLENNNDKFLSTLKAAKSGHGGGIDDIFKEFFKKSEVGVFNNAKVYERYMPNAKDRIEFLQEDVAKKIKSRDKIAKASLKAKEEEIEYIREQLGLNNELEEPLIGGKKPKKGKKKKFEYDGLDDLDEAGKKKAFQRLLNRLTGEKDVLEREMSEINNAKKELMTEILLIRNSVKAIRGEKDSLDKTIPVVEPEDEIDSFKSEFNDHIRDREAQIITDEAFNNVTKGHGGLMVDKLRENIEGLNVGFAKRCPALYENTNFGQIKYRRNQAEDVLRDINISIDDFDDELGENNANVNINLDDENVALLNDKGKDILINCILFDKFSRSGKTEKIDNSKYMRDVKWNEYDEKMDKKASFYKDTKKFVDSLEPSDIVEKLIGVAKGNSTKDVILGKSVYGRMDLLKSRADYIRFKLFDLYNKLPEEMAEKIFDNDNVINNKSQNNIEADDDEFVIDNTNLRSDNDDEFVIDNTNLRSDKDDDVFVIDNTGLRSDVNENEPEKINLDNASNKINGVENDDPKTKYTNGLLDDINKYNKLAKSVMAEYLFLDGMTRNSKTLRVEEKKLNKDVPLDKIKEFNTRNSRKHKKYKDAVGNIDNEGVLEMLESLSEDNATVFVTKLTNKYVEQNGLYNKELPKEENLKAPNKGAAGKGGKKVEPKKPTLIKP
ncbi:MAG: hypothetical protein K6F77_01170 [Lachnospiraceae bacterium]|nr:hypothetical protein [Lachnospiraceae bacterium]